ncbi:unnamed protein product [Ixodes pacificus]
MKNQGTLSHRSHPILYKSSETPLYMLIDFPLPHLIRQKTGQTILVMLCGIPLVPKYILSRKAWNSWKCPPKNVTHLPFPIQLRIAFSKECRVQGYLAPVPSVSKGCLNPNHTLPSLELENQ